MPESIDITPSLNSYTPSMAKMKTYLEWLLSKANDENLSADLFRKLVVGKTDDFRREMSIILAQDILYKAGVRYKPESLR
jgi:hypothetical protein